MLAKLMSFYKTLERALLQLKKINLLKKVQLKKSTIVINSSLISSNASLLLAARITLVPALWNAKARAENNLQFIH